jgi:hypothetical protein
MVKHVKSRFGISISLDGGVGDRVNGKGAVSCFEVERATFVGTLRNKFPN